MVLFEPIVTTDAGELVFVFATFFITMAVMVAFGAWWSR